jgi:subtilase family serine protease
MIDLKKLRLVFGLKPPKAEEERRFLDALYTEGSSQYHKFLTAKEGNDRFSPSAENEQAVVDWAPAQGLTVAARYPKRLLVDIKALASQFKKHSA